MLQGHTKGLSPFDGILHSVGLNQTTPISAERASASQVLFGTGPSGSIRVMGVGKAPANFIGTGQGFGLAGGFVVAYDIKPQTMSMGMTPSINARNSTWRLFGSAFINQGNRLISSDPAPPYVNAAVAFTVGPRDLLPFGAINATGGRCWAIYSPSTSSVFLSGSDVSDLASSKTVGAITEIDPSSPKLSILSSATVPNTVTLLDMAVSPGPPYSVFALSINGSDAFITAFDISGGRGSLKNATATIRSGYLSSTCTGLAIYLH